MKRVKRRTLRGILYSVLEGGTKKEREEGKESVLYGSNRKVKLDRKEK